MFGWGKKRRKQPAPAETVVEAAAEVSGSLADLTPPRHRYLVGLATDIGCVRAGNEDNARFIEPKPEGTIAERGLLVLVADGMGGHASGEVASEIAVDTVCREYFDSYASPEVALRNALESANRAIYDAARKDASKKGMGTTCTALSLMTGVAISAHVGDSRLYLVRGGGIYLMSEDHSAVMELVRQGLLTIEEARHHENKNLITRALGLHGSVEVATWKEPLPIQDGDRFLLCSDGLYDLVEDNEILNSVLTAGPEQACHELINLAKQRGGHDNITVIVVHVEPIETAESPIIKPTAESDAFESAAPETREAEVIS